MRNKQTKYVLGKILSSIFISIALSSLFFTHTEALDVDYYDNYFPEGNSFDKITWVDNVCTISDYWMTIGVYDETQDVLGYCVNYNKEHDSDFEFCLIKNSTYNECIDNMPVFPFTDTVTASDWAEADNVPQYIDAIECPTEQGNTIINDTKHLARGQIQYFNYETGLEIDTNPDSENNGRFYIGNDTRIAQEFDADFEMLRYVDLDFRDDGLDTATLRLRDELLSADLETATVSSGVGWQRFEFDDYELTGGEDYFLILDCVGCGDSTSNKWEWEICDSDVAECNATGYKGYRSTDYGVSFSIWDYAFAMRLYGGNKCDSVGTTSDISDYDYYFIDQIKTDCDIDGSNYYHIDGRYSISSYAVISNISCGATKICDTDHDDDTSTDQTHDRNDLINPCRLKEDEPCGASSECWNDAICSGADFNYYSNCDGELTDIYRKEWDDSCGGDGVLVDAGSLFQNDDDCVIDGGFPVGTICDSDFDDIDRTSIPSVYNDVCKGGEGNACAIDSDCHHDFECVAGFCAFNILAIYTDDEPDNKLYEGDTITYDNSLSVASDDNIQYACWSVASVDIECDGNSTQCGTECGGAFDNSNWDNGFSRTFNLGGNYYVDLLSGSKGVYVDNYNESYCVSGSGTYCFSCFDGLLNDDEIDVDFGGHCGYPYFLLCNNGILDNVTNETSIDYGGVCGNCDNTSISEDDELIFLLDSGLIVYPFDNGLCEESEAVQGSIVIFVLLISSLLIIPLLIIFLILFLLTIFFGTGFFALLLGLIRDKKLRGKAVKVIKNALKRLKK